MSLEGAKAQINTILQAEIIRALNEAPEALEKLVKAALSQPVDSGGDPKGYYGDKMPYLDWMVGEEIRRAARTACQKVIQEKMPDIETMVRQGLSSESVVAAVTNALVGAASNEWNIKVSFEGEKKR